MTPHSGGQDCCGSRAWATCFPPPKHCRARSAPGAANGVAILTNGGGFGVLATDAWLDAGGAMAALSEATIDTLDKDPAADLVARQSGRHRRRRRRATLRGCIVRAADWTPAVDTILALNCPTGVSSPIEAADGLLAAWAKRPKYAAPNLLACWLTANHGEAIRARFGEAGIPAFDTIESAIAGCAELAEFARNQRLMLRVPAQRRGSRAGDRPRDGRAA